MIIYLHGFNSSGASAKGQYLQSHLPFPVLTPSYHYDPAQAMAALIGLVEQQRGEDKLLLAGSSLGSFYAQYLAQRFRLPSILINPALGPIETLRPYLGLNTNFYTGEQYILDESHLDSLRCYQVEDPCLDPLPTLVLLDEGDEVIDYRYAVEKYRHCGQLICWPGGDHQFQHLAEALPLIEAFYQS